jgi:multidrug efflux pump subunit AcrA (membrane-fusion protein)
MVLNCFKGVVIAVCLSMLAACAPGAGGRPTPTALPLLVKYESALFPVERGTIVSEQKVVGEVTPSKQDSLFFRTSGHVTRVTVKAGDVINKGDLLAELDTTDLLTQLQQAKIDLEVTTADLAKNKAQAEYNLERAKTDVAILQKQVELGRLNVQQAQGLDRERAQLNLEITQENLTLAEAALKLATQQDTTFLDQAVKRSQLSVERIEGLLGDRQIIAPYDGMILRSSLRAGQQVDAYFGSFLVGDPTTLVIRSAYDFDVAKMLSPETDVTLFLTANEETGIKTQYLPNFRPEKGIQSSDDSSSTANYVYYELPKVIPAEKITIGQSVFLTILLGKKDDVLLLPPSAIREYKGLNFVIVQDGEKRRRVEINKIGLKSTEKWEVIADLKQGDLVIGP